MKGPVGERNVYTLGARGAVLCDAETEDAMIAQLACVAERGQPRDLPGKPAAFLLKSLPAAMREAIEVAGPASRFEAALTDRRGASLIAFLGEIARREGPIASVFRVDEETLAATRRRSTSCSASARSASTRRRRAATRA